MTRRDTYTLGVVAVLGLMAAFWFMMLSPKRSELTKLNSRVSESQSALQSARGEAQEFAKARQNFPTDYTTITRLGKAVPADPDIPSLIVQLDRAAHKAGMDFRKLTSESGSADAGPATPANTPPPTASSDSAAGATGASGTSGSGTTGAAGATGNASASASASASTSTTPAPADATLTATAPLGVDVGPAGLSLTKFSFIFQGSFFHMADLLHNIRSLVQRRNRQLVVSGRLITIGGIAMAKGDKGFPQVKVTVAADAYLLPSSQGLFAGATTQGPADATAATPSPPASPGAGAPPAAVVTPR
jgi:hypothetical protein